MSKLATADRRYLCLRQAGRALAIYTVGGDVSLIELLKNDVTGAAAHMAFHVNLADTRLIATAAYCVEHILFHSHQLVDGHGQALAEAPFVATAMHNAQQDKVVFFGSDHCQPDGMWPREMDEEFISFALRKMAPQLQANFRKIEHLAASIDAQERVYRDEIERDLGFNPT